MALPKRRHSRARTLKKRAHDALTVKGVSSCPRCDAVKEPHRVCANCGHYAGNEVIAMENA
jgi:large subunit ribosomal protein L32